MSTMIALLRGINVGRAKQVPMAVLRELLEGLGYADVRTHLRSGNAVFRADATPERAAREIEATIVERLGFEVPVIARTAADLAAVVADDPLRDVRTDGARHLVLFLPAAPDAAAVRAIAARDFGPERFVARGRELHLWCPNGINDSALRLALSASRGLAADATGRNWNTVTKLAEMAGGPAP